MAKRSAEPFLWLLFSSGGMAAALILPVLIFLFGVAFPLGWIGPPDHAHLSAVLRQPFTRLGMLGVCILSLWHWAHRFRFTLRDGLKLRRYDPLIAAACYGSAFAGTVAAIYLILGRL